MKKNDNKKREIMIIIAIVSLAILNVGISVYTLNNTKQKNNTINNIKTNDEINKNEETKTPDETNKNEETKPNDDTSQKQNTKKISRNEELKEMYYDFISNLNPMKNKCINTKIDKKCISDNSIVMLVYSKLDRDEKFETRERLVDNYDYVAESYDYVSYDVYKQYVKEMLGIEQYEIPTKFNTENTYCYEFVNTGHNIKRIRNTMGCRFGAHAFPVASSWIYNYESHTEDENNIVVTVTAMYEYNGEENGNIVQENFTDESRTVKVENYSDPRLSRLKYTFKKGENYLTLLSIELEKR